jgi:hypothetical protein
MTSTAPWRRMILHFSHIGLTDGRTFMSPFVRREEARAGRMDNPAAGATTECSERHQAVVSCQGVSTRGPLAVMAIVNSKCAASEPSEE